MLNFSHKKLVCWLIHAFTASGACLGLFALYAITQHQFLMAFWLMGGTILIDAVDGVFARLMKIKEVLPGIDGALLDNIVDFFTYTLVPSFFLLISPTILPEGWRLFGGLVIIFASAYQFTQVDAKTSDHFFKGFPCYWNIVVFYLFFGQLNPYVNISIISLLAVLCFVPIKYIYPSRLNYLSKYKWIRIVMLVTTILWGGANFGLLWFYPEIKLSLIVVSLGYCCFYLAMSLYRNWMPSLRHG